MLEWPVIFKGAAGHFFKYLGLAFSTANSVDPDHMSNYVAPDQGLYWSLMSHFWDDILTCVN